MLVLSLSPKIVTGAIGHNYFNLGLASASVAALDLRCVEFCCTYSDKHHEKFSRISSHTLKPVLCFRQTSLEVLFAGVPKTNRPAPGTS